MNPEFRDLLSAFNARGVEFMVVDACVPQPHFLQPHISQPPAFPILRTLLPYPHAYPVRPRLSRTHTHTPVASSADRGVFASASEARREPAISTPFLFQ